MIYFFKILTNPHRFFSSFQLSYAIKSDFCEKTIRSLGRIAGLLYEDMIDFQQKKAFFEKMLFNGKLRRFFYSSRIARKSFGSSIIRKNLQVIFYEENLIFLRRLSIVLTEDILVFEGKTFKKRLFGLLGEDLIFYYRRCNSSMRRDATPLWQGLRFF